MEYHNYFYSKTTELVGKCLTTIFMEHPNKNVYCLSSKALWIQISISYDLIIAALSNFNSSLKGPAKCSGMIFITIGT